MLPQSTFLPRSRGSPRAQLLQRIRFGGAAAREDFFPTPAGPRSCLGTSRRVHAHHAQARQPSASAARRGGARPGPCWASDARGPAPHPTCQLVGAQAAAVPSRPAPRKTRSGGRSRLPRGGAARRTGHAQCARPAPRGKRKRSQRSQRLRRGMRNGLAWLLHPALSSTLRSILGARRPLAKRQCG